MKEKLRDHYLKFGPRRFVIFAVITLLILDILSGYYLVLVFDHKLQSGQMIHLIAKRMNMQVTDFDPATLQEVVGLVNKTLNFFLFLVLTNNLFFYFFYLRKKLWAQGYVLFYTMTASILSLYFIFEGSNLGVGWTIFNVLTIPIYIYLFFGVKMLKAETTLVPEKKGR